MKKLAAAIPFFALMTALPAAVAGDLEAWTVFVPVDPAVQVSRLTGIPEKMQGPAGEITGIKMGMTRGRLDLAGAGMAAEEKKTAVLLMELDCPGDENLPVGAAADWWMEWHVNGTPVYSTMGKGNGKPSMLCTDHLFNLPLKKGRNLIAVKVQSGSQGFLLVAETGEALQKTSAEQARIAAARIRTGLNIPDTPELERIGHVRHLDARSIGSSRLGIGAETLDRGFADYEKYKAYLGPLGVKRVRFQSGWAKTEKTPGVYHYEWLDAVVDDAIRQGVSPWIELSYGNNLYPGGGGTTLGEGLPKSPDALSAWDRYVENTVTHYRGKVSEWSVWNEPDLKGRPLDEYAAFFLRTARIIRRVQPDAKIIGLSAAHVTDREDGPILTFLSFLQKEKALDCLDILSIHGYPLVPENQVPVTNSLRQKVRRIDPRIELWQGETGCPSAIGSAGALSQHDWTETTQAKWDARCVMNHLGMNMFINLFTLCDMKYVMAGMNGINRKGLLQIAPDTLAVVRAKPAYETYQHITAIFTSELQAAAAGTTAAPDPDAPAGATVQTYVSADHKTIVALWLGGRVPDDESRLAPMAFTLTGNVIKTPVYVNLLTGSVHRIPQEQCTVQGSAQRFTGIPVADYPVLVAERDLIPLQPEKHP